MKSKKPKDERVIALNHKLLYECFNITTAIIILSIVVKVIIFELSMIDWITEIIWAAVILPFMIVRSVMLKINIFGDEKHGITKVVLSTFSVMILAIAIYAVMRYIRYDEFNISHIYYVTGVSFALAAVPVIVIIIINAIKQKQIQKSLDKADE